jgi:DNA-binding PadR family transcriptional regulator
MRHPGEFELLVLAAIARLGDAAYGAAIRNEIEEKTDRIVSAGALYATLARLEAKQYVSSWKGAATPQRGGRAKRYFALTGLGRTQLEQSIAALHNLLEGVAL